MKKVLLLTIIFGILSTGGILFGVKKSEHSDDDGSEQEIQVYTSILECDNVFEMIFGDDRGRAINQKSINALFPQRTNFDFDLDNKEPSCLYEQINKASNRQLKHDLKSIAQKASPVIKNSSDEKLVESKPQIARVDKKSSSNFDQTPKAYQNPITIYPQDKHPVVAAINPLMTIAILAPILTFIAYFWQKRKLAKKKHRSATIKSVRPLANPGLS